MSSTPPLPRLRATVDPTLSSTYFVFNSSSNFSTVYADQSTVEGTYFVDALCIGGACIYSQLMTLATETSANVWRGVLGLGLITQESGVTSGRFSAYPTILDTLVRSGVIGSRTYSIWLDDYRKDISTLENTTRLTLNRIKHRFTTPRRLR